MARDITIRIAGRPYRIPADSPEKEELLREAARIVDEQMARREKMNVSGQDREDLLIMAALTIGFGYVLQKRQMKKMEEDERQLQNEIEGYLEKIDKYSR